MEREGVGLEEKLLHGEGVKLDVPLRVALMQLEGEVEALSVPVPEGQREGDTVTVALREREKELEVHPEMEKDAVGDSVEDTDGVPLVQGDGEGLVVPLCVPQPLSVEEGEAHAVCDTEEQCEAEAHGETVAVAETEGVEQAVTE